MPDQAQLFQKLNTRLSRRVIDPRVKWRQTARPDQLLPPLEDPWRVVYWQGGRGSGKTRTCAQGLAELVQGDTDGEGEYGIIGPTYADAWTKCVEGESGILRAMGTSMAQIKDHKSALVKSAWRTYGQVILHNGIIIYIDSAAEGGLRIQGRNLKGIWCVAADEEVTTQYGQIPIKDIRPGDYALTRGGWRRITDKALTKRRALVVMLKTDDGHSIRVTSDHKVWTMEAGWIPAGQIRAGMRTLCLAPRATSSGEASAGTGDRKAGITQTAQGACSTSRSGSTCISGDFLTAGLSTTVTTTRPTTGRATWWRRLGGSTWQSTGFLGDRMQSPHELISVQLRRHHGRHVNPENEHVLSATACSIPQGSEHASALLSTAQPSTVTSVEPSGHSDVYDLTVDGQHEFFASNILVKNCDEIGLWEKWETAWNESIRYAVRHGHSKILCDGTPKASRPARKLVRKLIQNDPEEGGVIVRRLRTIDNKDNLSPAFFRAVIGAAKGTRLERQELEGELLDDVANALWTREILESIGCGKPGQPDGPPHLRKVFIGVDPSDGTEDSDEQAYTVAGLGPGDDEHIYVAENWGGQEAPAPFAKRVILTARRWNATIVVEKNHGGEWLRTVFKQVIKELVEQGVIEAERQPRVQLIWASRSKRTRAEPVSSLYERLGGTLVKHCRVKTAPCTCEDRVHEHGHLQPDEQFQELEDQQATFTGASNERSPDRLDSLVWALTPFLKMQVGIPADAGQSLHKWAGQEELTMAGMTPAQIVTERRLAGVHGGAYDKPEGWDLDSFAPQADDGRERDRHGPRGNRHEWR